MSEENRDPLPLVQFEQDMQVLQEIVQQLETGQLQLAEAMQLYRQGAHLADHCQKVLQNCQLEVEIMQKQSSKTGLLSDYTDENDAN